jgi:hypothetical protein
MREEAGEDGPQKLTRQPYHAVSIRTRGRIYRPEARKVITVL